MKKLNKYIFTLLLLTIYNLAFGEGGGGIFSRNGVSFSYASNWSVTEQESIEGGGYYLAVEKDGFTSSGLVTVTWINEEISAYEYIEIIQAEYRGMKVFDNIVFKPNVQDSYNGISCVSCKFTVSVLGVKHRGVVYSFYRQGKSFLIVHQEAIEDITVNRAGFDLISSTFRVQ